MKDDQRVALTKRLLREGLLRLMEHKPIEKISVSELCTESGINRATFYRHYEQPRDVLLEIGRELIDGLHFDSWEIHHPKDLAQYAEFVFSYMEQHASILKILLQNRSDESLVQVIDFLSDTILRMKTKPSVFNDLDAESARLFSAYTVGGIYFMLNEWLVKGVEKTPKELAKLMTQFVVGGMTFSRPKEGE